LSAFSLNKPISSGSKNKPTSLNNLASLLGTVAVSAVCKLSKLFVGFSDRINNPETAGVTEVSN